jgi:hypothetical protein
MGWKERAWYVGGHEKDLFDRNGNAGPTIWADGRVIGAWGQTEGGEIVTRLLVRVNTETRSLIEAERERLRAWFGEVRIRTRFGTQLERSLAGR